jgi:uncharacterized repeat protein (TIGR03803 family)
MRQPFGTFSSFPTPVYQRLNSALLLITLAALFLVPSARAANKYETLYKFRGGKNGKSPLAGLVFDGAGKLYGTTSVGGANRNCDDGSGNLVGCGVVFELTPNADASWKEKVIYSFCPTDCSDGATPVAGLVVDAAGNLYGTTQIGGSLSCADGGGQGCGAVFQLASNQDGGWTESVLHGFTGGSDGAFCYAGLIFDKAGNLYGTTSGAANAESTVFKLTPNGDGAWSESVLYDFTGGKDGNSSRASVIFDQSGNLYGTTEFGGNLSGCGGSGCGVVFKLVPDEKGQWIETVLHTFSGTDGMLADSSLILDSAGDLYGVTAQVGNLNDCSSVGGYGGCGVVFKLTPVGKDKWTETVLHAFTGDTDGASPAGVIFDTAGNLYGTTVNGGNLSCLGLGYGCGVVFKLAPKSKGGWTETLLHTFSDPQGVFPYGGVTFDAAGKNLYGTTAGNGRTLDGTVFELAP